MSFFQSFSFTYYFSQVRNVKSFVHFEMISVNKHTIIVQKDEILGHAHSAVLDIRLARPHELVFYRDWGLVGANVEAGRGTRFILHQVVVVLGGVVVVDLAG